MPTAPTEIYAARAVRFGPHCYVVVTARTPWIRHILEPGFRGDHARWLTSGKRPDSLRRQLFGVDTIVPGPWPFGFKLPAGPNLHVIDVDAGSRALGWLLTAWALAHVIRHPRRH
jgi:hypothetical protein